LQKRALTSGVVFVGKEILHKEMDQTDRKCGKYMLTVIVELYVLVFYKYIGSIGTESQDFAFYNICGTHLLVLPGNLSKYLDIEEQP
jgi:hypothetical protein